jgi:hypothetical protein
MRASIVALLVAVLALSSATAWSQAAPREMQTGLKTTGESYATMTELSFPIAELATAPHALPDVIAKLTEDTKKAGLTPLGPTQVSIAGVFPPDPEGKVTLQILLPIIEAATADDLNGGAGVKVVKQDSARVAYTYPQGGLLQLQSAFFRLYNWVMAQGKDVAGLPTLVIFRAPTADDDSMIAELELAVK